MLNASDAQLRRIETVEHKLLRHIAGVNGAGGQQRRPVPATATRATFASNETVGCKGSRKMDSNRQPVSGHFEGRLERSRLNPTCRIQAFGEDLSVVRAIVFCVALL